ncbi:MAG TPA: ferritin-like protein [Kofleriaceae bacterium]|jgi:hypothetical protein
MNTQTETAATRDHWTIAHLRQHIQYAVDLELWTIPFYMSAMYSIKDRTSSEFQLIQTVVNQEMLHLQSAANIANAYGFSPAIHAPQYIGTAIPHLEFQLDKPDPRPEYAPYSAQIGPLDRERINAMCLIEYPGWDSTARPPLSQNVREYGSIGEFYQAVRHGAELLKDQLRGGVRQVDLFAAFYRNMPGMTVTESRDRGFYQVGLLVDLITDQGEGTSKKDVDLEVAFQNTADDGDMQDSHFDKFAQIRRRPLPTVYPAKPPGQYTAADKQLEQILLDHFGELRGSLERIFRGENPEDFVRLMISTGAAIQSCWKHGVTPRFS